MKTELNNNLACKGSTDRSFVFLMLMIILLITSIIFLVASIIKANRNNAVIQEEQGTHLVGVCTIAQSLPAISSESKILSCSVQGNQLSWIARNPVSTLELVSLNDLYRANWRITAVFSMPAEQVTNDGKTSLTKSYYVIDKNRNITFY